MTIDESSRTQQQFDMANDDDDDGDDDGDNDDDDDADSNNCVQNALG
jgi:hypothetical protein